MNSLFHWLTEQIRNTEHALITFVAAVIPWLVPVIPAYLTGYHIVMQLHLPVWSGWVIGAIVEGLGLASMSRTIAFWENNRKYTKDANKMPLLIPLGTYVWYLLIVIVVNVLLEKESGASNTRLWVIGLLATLSVPTAALISVTSIWTERLMEKERAKMERLREHRNISAIEPEVVPEVEEETEEFQKYSRSLSKLGRPSIYQDAVYEYLNKRLSEENIIASFGDVVRDLGISQSTASRLRNQWMQERGMNNE